MKTRLLAAALVCCLTFSSALLAQAPKSKTGDKKAPAPKGPADLLVDAWNKARIEPTAKTQAGFTNLIAAGMAYLVQFPTHTQVNTVVNQLGTFANGIDPKQAALRGSYLSLLKFEVTDQRYKEGATDAFKAALAAIDAVVADTELRQGPTLAALVTLREKIDTLAETPGSGRFLTDRERSYAHLLTLMKQTPRAEEQLKKLTGHAEKNVATMAREELNILEIQKAPFDLKFTGVDGKETDFAQLRGKVVAMYFFSTTSKPSTDRIEGLKQLHSAYRKRGFEVVAVSYDKVEDGEKLKKFVKDNRIAWPVHYDGKAASNAFSPKLNAYNSSLPRIYLFDKAGLLQTIIPSGSTNLTPNIPVTQLEFHVKRLLGIK